MNGGRNDEPGSQAASSYGESAPVEPERWGEGEGQGAAAGGAPPVTSSTPRAMTHPSSRKQPQPDHRKRQMGPSVGAGHQGTRQPPWPPPAADALDALPGPSEAVEMEAVGTGAASASAASPPLDETPRKRGLVGEVTMREKRRRQDAHGETDSEPRFGPMSPCELPHKVRYECGTCGAKSAHRHCDACRVQRRQLQDTAPMELGARDESTITAERVFSEKEGFAKNETKKLLTMLSALPLSLRKTLRQYLTFEDMTLERFRQCCLEWANVMHVGCSQIPLFTHANAKNPAVKKRSFESKTQRHRQDGVVKPKTGWCIWDDNKKMWFRCFMADPPWEGCFQLEVITMVESDEVVVYTGAVGRFLQQDGIFETFVKIFEARFVIPVHALSQNPPMMVEDRSSSAHSHPTTDDSFSRIRRDQVTIFVTVRGSPDRTETNQVMCHKIWGWSMNDLIDKLGPYQYPRGGDTKFQLRDVLLDESDFLVKPGQVIFDYSPWPDIPVNVMLCKELVVIPLGTNSQQKAGTPTPLQTPVLSPNFQAGIDFVYDTQPQKKADKPQRRLSHADTSSGLTAMDDVAVATMDPMILECSSEATMSHAAAAECTPSINDVAQTPNYATVVSKATREVAETLVSMPARLNVVPNTVDNSSVGLEDALRQPGHLSAFESS
eukprot:m.62722 g.62722  ORF g.62722 m.62722 type:complete len:665 (+) comp9624_c0_seq4:151-2145(+)